MTTIETTAANIQQLINAGAKRWTKGKLDRLYVNATILGLEYDCYKSGNVRSATWQGEGISNADARRLLGSKVFVDLNTGDLHVSTNFDARCKDGQELDEAAASWLDAILAPASADLDALLASESEPGQQLTLDMWLGCMALAS